MEFDVDGKMADKRTLCLFLSQYVFDGIQSSSEESDSDSEDTELLTVIGSTEMERFPTCFYMSGFCQLHEYKILLLPSYCKFHAKFAFYLSWNH
ncbi:hypothetical protein OUZ56_032936 [Daphnia magna]|uniref:Uncharacterized protein n=1 Tax=Daphnia magna TaxID=35525 RepID=A0ABQ9ZX85_9CRUS|nr:hypothetical protein OUZ56_032936 [Daphnia magna]